jgi:hypothetical protein
MNSVRDDRVLVLTRIVAAIVIFVLLLAFLALYVFPDRTATDFAWTIQPGTSALLIGAGYAGGGYFFVRLIMDGKWHRVQRGFLPITVFTIFMLAATFLHWSRFHLGALNFILWTTIYIVTPFLVPFIWWQNRRISLEGLEENDLRFPSMARWALGSVGVLGTLIFVIMFIKPAILINLTPWRLTELTAQVFAGWSILAFCTLLSIAYDGRWSATRVLMESALLTITLTLLALPRMWKDFDHEKLITYLFIISSCLTWITFVVIHLWLDRLSRLDMKRRQA